MSSPNPTIFLQQAFVNAIEEIRAILWRGSSTHAQDVLSRSERHGSANESKKNQGQLISGLRNTDLPNLKAASTLSFAHQHLLQAAMRAKRSGAGNCHEQAILLAAYLWHSAAPEINRIEVVNGGRGFDHVFLVINRPHNTKLNDPASWGEQTWLVDPWSKTVKNMADHKAVFKAMYEGGRAQTKAMLDASISKPWVFTHRGMDSMTFDLRVKYQILPKVTPYPDSIDLSFSLEKSPLKNRLIKIKVPPRPLQARALKS